jgi:hypothetical protein
MSYIITVPAYPSGLTWLQEEINRLMVELNASHYVAGEFALNGHSVDYKVIFTLNAK